MGAAQEDVLGWLLPHVGPADEQHARRVVTFLRLLCDGARGRAAETVGIDLQGARRELERGDRVRGLEALADLLRSYLSSAQPQDGFLSLGQAHYSFQEAWSLLEGVEVPSPEEPVLETAGRLLHVGPRLGASPTWRSIWRTRLLHTQHGFDRARPAWRRLLQRAERTEDATLGGEALQGLVAGSLERGDPGAAKRYLDRGARWVNSHGELPRYRDWVMLLLGAAVGSAPLAASGIPKELALPQPLAQLRQRVPAWSGLLSGVARSGGRAPLASVRLGRLDLGAAGLGVIWCDPRTAEPRAVCWDLGTRLGAQLQAHQARRQGAWLREGEAEQRVLATGQCVIWHRLERAVHPAAIGARSKALALVPLQNAPGDARGWLHLEFEHHLVPSSERLAALANAWLVHLQDPANSQLSGAPVVLAGHAAAQVDASLKAAAMGLLRRLPLRLWGRRVALVERPIGAPARVLAQLEEGGGRRVPRIGPCVQRVLESGAPHGYARDPAQSCFEGSASGVLAPLKDGARVAGVLLVESSRPEGLGSRELELLSDFAQVNAQRWLAEQFDAWHRQRFGESVALPFTRRAWSPRSSSASSEASRAVLLSGAAQTGKLVLARWLHYKSSGPERPFVALGRGPLAEAWSRARGGTLLLGRHASSDPALLAELSRRLAGSRGAMLEERVRVIALAWDAEPTLARSREAEAWRSFERIRVPSLHARRDLLPELVECLLERMPRLTGSSSIRLNDAAMGLLWRQPWPGNLGQLSALLERAASLGSGAELGPEDLLACGEGAGQALLKRLPSLQPNPLDIRAALAQTRFANGRRNKRRAALYLGWDPSTLAARMRELDLDQRG